MAAAIGAAMKGSRVLFMTIPSQVTVCWEADRKSIRLQTESRAGEHFFNLF
jgi:hypothetical protein